MATLGANVLTLTDWAKTRDPDGTTADIVNLLAQSNEIVEDMVWQEGNLPTGHRVTVQTSLPQPGWRRFNEGGNATKGTTAQFDEHCGMMDDWSEIDCKLAALNGDLNAFRLAQAQPHLEGLSQEFASTLFYGNHLTAETEFTGFAPRYATIANTEGQNMIDAGGAGADNSSIWLLGWGPGRVYGCFPKGSRAGIEHTPYGKSVSQRSVSGGTSLLEVYRDHWQWDCGLVIEDWRYAVRIGSIDISALVADGAGATVKLLEYMLRAIHRLPTMNGIRPKFYMNRSIRAMLDVQAMTKPNLHLVAGMEEGQAKTHFRGIELRTCDALTETEALI
jgi:hypothetical protein